MFISGPYEFISDDGLDQAEKQAWLPLLQAYGALGYDAGAFTPLEAKAMAELGGSAPANWLTLAAAEPVSTVIERSGRKIGVVYFPEGKKPGDGPNDKAAQAIARKLKELRGSVDLVVGVSPWGTNAESEYLEKTKPELDILLGSGSGVGFSAKTANAGRTLWMRTYSKGKAVYTVDVLAWPGAKNFKWEQGTSFTTQAVVLDENFPADPAMEKLLENVPDPGDKQAK